MLYTGIPSELASQGESQPPLAGLAICALEILLDSARNGATKWARSGGCHAILIYGWVAVSMPAILL